MTAFRLKKKESEKKGIRRVAHGRAEDALGLLRDEDADPAEAVHEARKDMKKLRATLKLVRPLIGDETYSRENARFRDAGRALSDVRDAQVRAETVDALAERFADDPPPGGWWALRALLADDDASGNGELESLRERAAERDRARRRGDRGLAARYATGSTSCAQASSGLTRAGAGASATRGRNPATRRFTSGASAPRTSGITCGSCAAPGPR